MGYEGGDLAALFTAAGREATRRAPRRMAQAGGEAMTRKAKRLTPVRTGRARGSIDQKPTVQVVSERGETVWASGAESDDYRLKFLEDGVKPHEIARKGVQRFAGPEGTTFARRVEHPGIRGLHMFALAAAETEAEFDAICRPALEAWKAGVRRGR